MMDEIPETVPASGFAAYVNGRVLYCDSKGNDKAAIITRVYNVESAEVQLAVFTRGDSEGESMVSRADHVYFDGDRALDTWRWVEE